MSSRTGLEFLAKVPGSTVRGRYVHWDKLRHLTPPEGLDHESWWYALKLHRLYHAEIVRRAIEEMHAYIERHTQRLATAQRDLQGLTILNHRQRDLISHALRHSGQQYTVEYHRNSHNVVYETARTDMMDLVDRGLMVKRKIGKTWHFTPAPDLEARLRGPA